jgi:hypothetical protein
VVLRFCFIVPSLSAGQIPACDGELSTLCQLAWLACLEFMVVCRAGLSCHGCWNSLPIASGICVSMRHAMYAAVLSSVCGRVSNHVVAGLAPMRMSVCYTSFAVCDTEGCNAARQAHKLPVCLFCLLKARPGVNCMISD